MTRIPSFSPSQSVSPEAESANGDKTQAQLPHHRKQDVALPKATLFQPGATARRHLLQSQAKGMAATAHASALPHADPASLAATAALFNPFLREMGPLARGDTVVGFGGLTYAQEMKSFPGIYMGFSDPKDMKEKAEAFLLNSFRPSKAVGF